MRRFPATTPYYPSGFNAEALANNQSPVPSQRSPVPPAFDPSKQPDMMPSAPLYVPAISIVRNSFDSRPVNSYDWYWEDQFRQGPPSVTSGYNVPNGYILILRELIISAYPAQTADLLNDPVMDPFGNQIPGNQVNLFININGAGAPSWTQTDPVNMVPVSLFDLFIADLQIETFVLVGSANNLTIEIPGFTSGLGGTRWNINVKYYGNMLLATGRTLVGEVGNIDPLLIAEPNQ